MGAAKGIRDSQTATFAWAYVVRGTFTVVAIERSASVIATIFFHNWLLAWVASALWEPSLVSSQQTRFHFTQDA